VWCQYECFITLVKAKIDYKYDVYTAHAHRVYLFGRSAERSAVGITDGPAEADLADGDVLASMHKTDREKAFPRALARKGLDVRVENAQASQPADRRHILNAIAGRPADEVDLEPHASHPRYTELDQTLRGRFLACTWRKLVEEGEDMARWAQPLRESGLRKLEVSFAVCKQFDDAQAQLLAGALPDLLDALDLGLAYSGVGVDGTRALFSAAARLPRLARLRFNQAKHGGAAAPEFARAARQHDQVASLELSFFRIGDSGAREIAEYVRASRTLTELNLLSNKIGDEGAAAIGDALRANGALTKVRALLSGTCAREALPQLTRASCAVRAAEPPRQRFRR
jgi:hypothetical protein